MSLISWKPGGVWSHKAVRTAQVGTLALSGVMFIGMVQFCCAITGENVHDNLVWNQKAPIEEPVAVVEEVHGMTDTERLANGIYAVIAGHDVSDTTATMVGEVIINRRNSHIFPNTIDGVLSQPYQFGDLSKGYSWKDIPESPDAIMAYVAAEEALSGSSLVPDDCFYVSENQQGELVAMLDGLYFGR